MNNLHLKYTITSLVVLTKNLFKGEQNSDKDMKKFCKKSLINLACCMGIERVSLSKTKSDDKWYKIYHNKQFHNSLNSFIENHLKTWREDPFFREEKLGSCVTVYTYNLNLSNSLNELGLKTSNTIYLSNILSKN